MAQIKKYERSELITSPSMPQTTVRDPGNAALQQLGEGVSSLAEHFQQQQQTKEDFQTETNYRKLQLTLGDQFKQSNDSIAEDGSNFHDSFMKDVYRPARDQFLAGVPERLRDRYSALLKDGDPNNGTDEGLDTKQWSVKAATQQRDQLNTWYKNQLQVGQEELATAISYDPGGYDKVLQSGIDQINSSGLSTNEKEAQRQAWTKMAQIAHLNKTLETNPEAVLKDLGADPRYLTPTTQFQLLKKAVTHQESGGNPNLVSPKGAIGLMQVMPGTAKDISKWMGDGLIDKGMSDARITEIMSNPVTNERYGDFYLKKMIKDYAGKGGVEAALVGYNAGPAVAKQWIESGYDNSVLPRETKNYIKSVMGQLPSTFGSKGLSDAPKGDPSQVTLDFITNSKVKAQNQGESNVNPDVVNRVKTAFAGLGINRVKITNGYRDKEDNAAVGGATGSEHQHHNAMDIDVSGYSIPERTNIIKALSAAGITGIGVGSNIIHADIGGRRAWGYANSAGGGDVPAWAKAAIGEHLSNSAQAPSRIGVGGRYAGLPYDKRQQFIHAADQSLTKLQTELAKGTAGQRNELRLGMRNELASLQGSGQSIGAVDDTAVSTMLGEDDYVKWIAQKERALRTHTAKDGIGQMSLQEMDDRLRDYTPEPGSATFADDQQVHAAVQKEIDNVQRVRARDPAQGAMQFPDVKAAWDKVQVDNPAPEAVQEFVRLNLERQKDFGIKPGSEEPVPRPWAVTIGQQMSKIPELKGKNSADVNASILVMYDSLHKVFGDYTDEVIISALKEYKGVGPNTAELVTGYMQAIQNGGDPLARVRQRQSQALDKDQVEETTNAGFWSNLWTGTKDFFNGERSADQGDGLRPFTPGERQDNPDGTHSTEISTTWQTPDGKWVNVPSLWKDKSGKTVQFNVNDEDGILSALKSYEARSGKQLKRFDSEDAAVSSAKARSAAGGADADDADVNPDMLLRAMNAVENLGDDMTPEQEQSLVRRFGQKTINAAKMRAGKP